MKFENTNVYNIKEAIRAARYSFSSEDRSDTTPTFAIDEQRFKTESGVVIGRKDKQLIESLIKAGSSHRKFMRAILLTVDISAPRYWWTQFDTYKVGVTAISESTMHTIMKKPFEMADFSFVEGGSTTEREVIDVLESLRKQGGKYAFNRIISLLPQGYIQKRHVAMNYEVVRNIIAQRRGHKLSEWAEFCEWAAELPSAYIFFGDLFSGDCAIG